MRFRKRTDSPEYGARDRLPLAAEVGPRITAVEDGGKDVRIRSMLDPAHEPAAVRTRCYPRTENLIPRKSIMYSGNRPNTSLPRLQSRKFRSSSSTIREFVDRHLAHSAGAPHASRNGVALDLDNAAEAAEEGLVEIGVIGACIEPAEESVPAPVCDGERRYPGESQVGRTAGAARLADHQLAGGS